MSFDARLGTVSAVLPFDGTRGAKRSTRTEGETQIFSGSFLGVFDGAGKNLAPNGATEVRLNTSTGQIVAR